MASTAERKFHRFNDGASLSCHNLGENRELYDKLSLCKSNLKLKKKQIRLLKGNLRKACIVAKTVMSVKENETISLHNHINSARSECADLSQKNERSAKTIRRLSAENRLLKEKIEHLENFIELGYQELQKIRNRPLEKIPIVMQLKEIMLSCGQYYADYSNEHVTCLKIEQKNRFLSNKISIIENNLQAVKEVLNNLQYQNIKLQKENILLKDKYFKQIENYSEITGDAHASRDTRKVQIKQIKFNGSLQSVKTEHSFDLKSHLSLVENLLNNQDIMLKDLKNLSEELKIT